ncbi:uncharacterized protein LOC135691859 [Rhopilema esculentum]|uniref:uncharacterized protein LOC135691859 n=1 Tax=Rhopilema esculentum TaxID=499914 RepID=UPI0031D940D8|eukprot:gene8973-16614_t
MKFRASCSCEITKKGNSNPALCHNKLEINQELVGASFHFLLDSESVTLKYELSFWKFISNTMDLFEAKLIEEVQKHPHLYDSSSKEYRDAVKIQNSWEKISRNLNVTVEIVRKKWKYLRECYVKSRKISMGNWEDGRLSKANKYVAMLTWLAPFVKHRPIEITMPSNMDTVSLESHDDEMAIRHSPAPIGISASPTTSGSSSVMTYTQNIPRKRSQNQTERESHTAMAAMFGEDEFSNFGKTVADTLRTLPKISQVLAKKRINDILFEAEMEAIRASSGDGVIILQSEDNS